MTAGLFVSLSFRSDASASNYDVQLHIGESRGSGSALRAAPERRKHSQKTLRIDVDLELEIALGLGAASEPLAQIFRQIDVALRLHQNAETITPLNDRKRGLGRAQHLDPLIDRRDGHEFARKAFRGGTIAGGDDQARQPSERR